MDTRRSFLKKAAMLAGAGSLAGIMPPSVQKALALNAPEGSTYLDAEHVVILMQENRSFDHCFGTMKGVRGFNDPRAISLPDKNKVWLQSDSKNTFAPFHLDINSSKATWMSSLPHARKSQLNAWNKGLHDKWIDSKRSINPFYRHMPLTMGYYTRQDLPFYYALADAFTICDQNFCSSLTGTNPNRLYFWTGTVTNAKDDRSKPCLLNGDMNYETLNWTTFPERLEKNGISWKCYQNELGIDTGLGSEEEAWLGSFQDNPLEYFEQYHVKRHRAYQANIENRITSLKELMMQVETELDMVDADAQLTEMAQQLDELEAQRGYLGKHSFESLSAFEQNLHKKAFDTNSADPAYRELTELTYNDNGKERIMKVPKGDILHSFRQDVINDKLPTVSWLVAPENFSDHPAAPWFGASYVSEVLDILTRQPEVWKKTIFILAYDENDGYFDHVPPFCPPVPGIAETGKASVGLDTAGEFEMNGTKIPDPVGLGYRVPLMIISPWTKGGWVNSQVFDHTSTLRFLEDFLTKKTGKPIVETNISAWRRNVCGDLTSVFRPNHSDNVQVPKMPGKQVFLESVHQSRYKKLPDNYRALTPAEINEINSGEYPPFMPQQEAGVSPSCALPYQLYADGNLNAERNAFEVLFNNRKDVFGEYTAGAAFNVYVMGQETKVRSYAVKPGDRLSDSWAVAGIESDYQLRVYGPNGFYREFAGNGNDPSISIALDYESIAGRLTGNVMLRLKSSATTDHLINITDNAYQTNNHRLNLAAGGSLNFAVDLRSSLNWYDMSVDIAGFSMMKRYAGRVETGEHGYTDPFMGRALHMLPNIIAKAK